jgi:hypothetical protein
MDLLLAGAGSSLVVGFGGEGRISSMVTQILSTVHWELLDNHLCC